MNRTFDRSEFRLIGEVQTVDIEFSNLEVVDGVVTEKYTTHGSLRFDAKGRLVEEVAGEREVVEQVYRDVYVWGKEDIPIEREEFARDGTLLGKTLFNIDEERALLVRHFYPQQPDGKLILGSITTFDQHKNFVENVYYSAEGKEVSRTRPSERPHSGEKRHVTQVNEGSVVEEKSFDPSGNLTYKALIKFDRRGNEMELMRYDPDGTMWQHWINEYEFDQNGNWVQCIQWYWVIGWGPHKLIPFTKTIRRISYYGH